MGKSPSVGYPGFYMRAGSAFGYHSRWHGRPRRHQEPLPRSLPPPSGSTRHGKSTCSPTDVPTQFFRFLAWRPIALSSVPPSSSLRKEGRGQPAEFHVPLLRMMVLCNLRSIARSLTPKGALAGAPGARGMRQLHISDLYLLGSSSWSSTNSIAVSSERTKNICICRYV